MVSTLALLLPVGLLHAQQDPQYSQYMFNQIGINPAYAGTRDVLSANLFYRNQWTGFPGAPNTEVFNVQAPVKGDHIGLGLQVVGDQIGPIKTTSFLTTYSYKFKLGKGHLSFGLSAGLMDQVIDYSKINYKDQSDPYASLGTTGKMLPTFDGGMYYYTRDFYIGVSFTHLNQPAYGSIKDSAGVIHAALKTNTFFTLGKAWALNDNLVFRPSVLLKYIGGAPGSIDFNFSFLIRKALWLGTTLRTGGTVSFIAEYNFANRLRIGYAYDITVSKYSAYGRSSHELFLGYDLNLYKSRTLTPRYF